MTMWKLSHTDLCDCGKRQTMWHLMKIVLTISLAGLIISRRGGLHCNNKQVQISPFFFHGPIRSDDQPPVPHIVSIFSIHRDPVCPPWFAPCFQSSISWCCYCMTSLVFHAFPSHSLSPGSRTSSARTRRLWLCVQSRRVCDVQQILAFSYYLTMYSHFSFTTLSFVS